MDNQEYEKVQKQAQERKKRYLLRSLHRFRTAMVLSVVAVCTFVFVWWFRNFQNKLFLVDISLVWSS